MKSNKITISILTAPGGDWKGLYINGELIKEDHDISAADVIENIKVLCPNIKFSEHEVDDATFEEQWGQAFPERFDGFSS